MSETRKRNCSEASGGISTFLASSFIYRCRPANISLAASRAWSSRCNIWVDVSLSEGFGPDVPAVCSNTNNNVASTCFIDSRITCPRFAAGVIVAWKSFSSRSVFIRKLPHDNSLRVFSTTAMSGLMDSTKEMLRKSPVIEVQKPHHLFDRAEVRKQRLNKPSPVERIPQAAHQEDACVARRCLDSYFLRRE
jgi:hypothetical protein